MADQSGAPLDAVRAQRSGVRVAMGDVKRAAAAAAADRIVPWAVIDHMVGGKENTVVPVQAALATLRKEDW